MRLQQLAGMMVVASVTACGGGGGGGVTNPNPTTGSVRGSVTDNTGAPVVGATVVLSAAGQANRSATTAATGLYAFNTIPAGAFTVTVTVPTGYTAGAGGVTAPVTVVAGQQANVAAIVLTRNAPTPAPTLVNVSMANTAFNPQNIELAVGGTVRFTNNDVVVHNATGTNLTTGNMDPGAVVSRVINVAGTINYSCTLHSGMNGTIVVR